MVMLTSYEDLLIQPPLWRAPPALGLFLLTSSNTAPGNLLVFNKHGLGWGGVGC